MIATGLALAACGGGSGSATISTASGPRLPDSVVSKIGDADLEIFANINSTRAIVGHPVHVRQAEQLLKPLIVAGALKVNSSNQGAGGLVENLVGQLDGVVPGLTSGTGSQEHLDTAAVHRLLAFGLAEPTKVFRPEVAQGVTRLEVLLRGKPAGASMLLAGQSGSLTARGMLLRDARETRPYWPDLSKRLEKLQGSLS